MISIRQKMGVLSQVIALSLLFAPAAIAKTTHHHKTRMACNNLPNRQVGRAMFYGPGFDGRIMANGKVFDMYAPTAASRTLPLGTRARVTNMHTGRSTIVTITDRGRLNAKNVIVDLSVGAAREIGLTEKQGVAQVEIKPISCNLVAMAAPAPFAERHADNVARQ